MKIDRLTGKYLITNLDETENFVGTGSKYIYDLQWPMDMKSSRLFVTVAGEELLKSPIHIRKCFRYYKRLR